MEQGSVESKKDIVLEELTHLNLAIRSHNFLIFFLFY